MPIDVHGKDIWADPSRRNPDGSRKKTPIDEERKDNSDPGSKAKVDAGGGNATANTGPGEAANQNPKAPAGGDTNTGATVGSSSTGDTLSQAEYYKLRRSRHLPNRPLTIPPPPNQSDIEGGRYSQYSKSQKLQKRDVFRYTILHDFESLFWMGLWGLVYHQPTSYVASIYDERLLEQITAASSIFPPAPRKLPLIRYSILMLEEELEDVVRSLPPIFNTPGNALVELRDTLVAAYKNYYTNSVAKPLLTFEENISFYDKFQSILVPITLDEKYNFQLEYVSDELLDRAIKSGFKGQSETAGLPSLAERNKDSEKTSASGKGPIKGGKSTSTSNKGKTKEDDSSRRTVRIQVPQAELVYDDDVFGGGSIQSTGAGAGPSTSNQGGLSSTGKGPGMTNKQSNKKGNNTNTSKKRGKKGGK